MILARKIEGKTAFTYIEDRKFDKQHDVIIAGLGTAGIVAAAAASQRGLKTLGIERLNCAGGSGTAGSVVAYYFGSKGGLYESIEVEAREAEKLGFCKGAPVNNDARKYAYEQAFLKAGGEIIYEATVCGIFLEGGRNDIEVEEDEGEGETGAEEAATGEAAAEEEKKENLKKAEAKKKKSCSGSALKQGSIKKAVGVMWFDGFGFHEAGAKVVIDCTAEAAICELAGCSLTRGRDIDCQAQPYSNVLIRFAKGTQCYGYTDCGYVDQSDAELLSHAIVDSATMLLHLKDSYTEDNRFLQIAPLIGVREGYIIKGEDSITFDDYLNDRITSKPVFYAYSNIDNHGKDLAFESENQKDWAVACSLWGLNISIPVPAGALIPAGYDGILAAGRHIAIDHDIASALRMKRDMQKCGEAAAIIAYTSIRKRCALKKVRYSDILPMLLEYGCLDEKNNVGLKNSISHNDDLNIPVKWFDRIDVTDEIKEALSSDKPGIAIWSCRRLGRLQNEAGSSIRGILKEWLAAPDRNLSVNSAFALALIGGGDGKKAAPILRSVFKERDRYAPKTSRSYNQERGYTAVYLLGRLKDPDAVEDLLQVICEPEKIKAEIGKVESNEFIGSADELYFQYFSHSFMSLLSIGDKYPDKRPEIAARILNVVEKPDFKLVLTLKSSNKLIYDMTGKIRGIVRDKTGKWWSEIINR